jgi:hypothetical protein
MMNGNCFVSRHRNVWPVYEHLGDYRPTRMETDRWISLKVDLNISYTTEDAELVRDLLSKLCAIANKLPKNETC